MADSHEYNLDHWRDYYEDKIDEKTRFKMTLHLPKCSGCLEQYTQCVEANILPAPLEMKKEIMREIKKPIDIKQIMFAYVAAASIAMGFYSFGWLDKTVDYAPKGMEKSFNAIIMVSENASQITNNIIWRDFNEKEK